ncbi:MAG TPA: phosphatase [Cytophagales bacterium]|nr:phosphatase [Cytophagales bacterium]
MKLAAIDIGSNAIRLQVTNVLQDGNDIHFKKLEYVRFPLRLGHDVFAHQAISLEKEAKFIKLMQAYQLLLELYEVDDYLALATSAMREARNGQALADQGRQQVGLDIRIIDGETEAAFINRAVLVGLDRNPYLHIDVGGGSTELTLIENRKKVASISFPIGSVRRLDHQDAPEVWTEMQQWIVQHTQAYAALQAIGTGGNINKLFDMAGKKLGKSLSRNKIAELRDRIQQMPMDERLNHLKLNPDRADVIVPAADIYLQVMIWAKAEGIFVPDVGLKDGMLRYLYENQVQMMNHPVGG